jgi:predicted RNA-binding Zn-ribbon protein involved in translation (DUF1610 family)
MPISVKCQECGKGLKAPDALAGKKAKCPQCGAVVPIPRVVVDAEEIDDEPPQLPRQPSATSKKPSKPKSKDEDNYDDTFDDLADYEANAPALPNQKRKPCPMCGEMILAEAAKCRFCGEILDPALRKREKKSKSSSGTSDELSTGDILLCVLCSGIGCIVGLVALIRGDTSRGGKMLGISLAMQLFWGVVKVVIEQAGKQ